VTGGASTGGASTGGANSGGSGAGGSGSGGVAPLGGAGGAPEAGIPRTRPPQTCVAPPTRNEIAPVLSQTGCVDPLDPKKPAPSLVPYDVASPLWSDNAEKKRYLALPDGSTISVKDCERDATACAPESPAYYQDEGDWQFADGTVFVKTFELGGRPIETRLLVQKDAFTWWGYSYEWRADGSDADLLDSNTDGYLREIQTADGTQTWHFPSRNQCLVCHTETSGRSLGPETVQMNFDYTYPNGVTANQLETMIGAGLFPAGAEPKRKAALPDPADASQSLEARARSYLHANCATCHRPGAESATPIDLRFETPFAETVLCNQAPEKGDLGVPGALRLVPGQPDKSVLSLRMHTLDTMDRMPRIGTLVVDPVGAAVVDQWIASVQACP